MWLIMESFMWLQSIPSLMLVQKDWVPVAMCDVWASHPLRKIDHGLVFGDDLQSSFVSSLLGRVERGERPHQPVPKTKQKKGVFKYRN